MKVAVASDHAGLELKEYAKTVLAKLGHEVVYLGSHSEESVDYPDFAQSACRKVLGGEADRAVLVCGSGIGMSMAANRFKGIRAALCDGLYTARFSRLHNDANVLCLPGRLMRKGLAEAVLKLWFSTEFEGGRHGRRVKKLDE
jgi:ribose 5-phosphate isomerase B